MFIYSGEIMIYRKKIKINVQCQIPLLLYSIYLCNTNISKNLVLLTLRISDTIEFREFRERLCWTFRDLYIGKNRLFGTFEFVARLILPDHK